jgi:hypothetical protein
MLFSREALLRSVSGHKLPDDGFMPLLGITMPFDSRWCGVVS